MLADTMGMSTSSLYRKVKGLSGLSPNDFIRIARLKKAILLMQNGENRISEIAFKSAFRHLPTSPPASEAVRERLHQNI